jgi:hypothetical protein
MSAPYGTPDNERLAGLVFELASQLHVERARRIALEAVLRDAGLVSEAAIQTAGAAQETRALTAAALDKAMGGLMRVVTEGADPRQPLRKERV